MGLTRLADRVRDAAASGGFPVFDPRWGETVLVPDAPGPGHWVGAPSVVVDPDAGRVLMAYRRRRPRDGSACERGYLVEVGASQDGGRSFHPIWRMTKEAAGSSSLERFCLRRAPGRGWLLYTSWEDPPSSGRWRISVLGATAPDRFDPAHARPLLSPAAVGVDAVKDPFVCAHGGRLRMYVSTFLTPAGPAPTCVAESDDGESFRWRGESLAVGAAGAWDAYQARISCVVPFDDGFVAFYDGAASRADDTEEHCGLAVSLDLTSWRRVTQDGPALRSPHATRSLRYVDAVTIAGAWWAYYEYTRADGSHELRRSRLAAPHTPVSDSADR